MKRIVCALDPGTGASSPTGFVAFDPDSRELLHAQNVTSSHKRFEHRIKDIAEQVSDGLSAIDPELEVFVYIESFVMRGKAGEMLARLTGALMSAIPYEHNVGLVYNTTVKKRVGGSGRADKKEVAKGVYLWAAQNPATKKAVGELIEAGEMDVLDAFAIGIAGWMGETHAR